MSIIDIKDKLYYERRLLNNYAAEYAKRECNSVRAELDAHSGASVLDHPDASVTASKLAPASVTEEKLAGGAVTEAKVADGAITETKLADCSVSADKLNDSLMETIDMAIDTAESAKLESGNALKAANTARDTADKADTASETAVTAANNALTVANGIAKTASDAFETAAAARDTADTVKDRFDTKAELIYASYKPGDTVNIAFNNTSMFTGTSNFDITTTTENNETYATVTSTVYSNGKSKGYTHIKLPAISEDTTVLTIEMDTRISDRRWWISLCSSGKRGDSAGTSSSSEYADDGLIFKHGTGAEAIYYVNGAYKGVDLRNKWIRSVFRIDMTAKTVAYVISDRETGSEIMSGTVAFLDEYLSIMPDCIELYSWSDTVLDIDNLKTTAVKAIDENNIIAVQTASGACELYGCKDGKLLNLVTPMIFNGYPTLVGSWLGEPIWRMAIERTLTDSEIKSGSVAIDRDIPFESVAGATEGVYIQGHAWATYSNGAVGEGITLREFEPFSFNNGGDAIPEGLTKLIAWVEFATEQENLDI